MSLSKNATRMHQFNFQSTPLNESVQELRSEVREFLRQELALGTFTPTRNSWGTFDASFSKKCGERGYIGVMFPKEYGGRGLSALHRFVIAEEMLAAGAPVGAHWVPDRQSGLQILHHGSERAKREILPMIAKGECYFGIGMSEPDSGSDLASVRCKAVKVDGGWRITGTKIWTSNAHHATYLIVLLRTESRTDDRHAGLTQLIVDAKAPGLTIRPVHNLAGKHDFNEMVFDGVFVPDDMLLGEAGQGWKLVTGELAQERSAPDRFMSMFPLFLKSIDELGTSPDRHAAAEIGRFMAHLTALRFMSQSIAGMLEKGMNPVTEAALVKDVGTTLEREMPERLRLLLPCEPTMGDGDRYQDVLGASVLRAPGYTIRGGTREILRGMIARGLGLR